MARPRASVADRGAADKAGAVGFMQATPPQAVQLASGRAGVPPADSGVPPGSPIVGRASNRNERGSLFDLPGGTPDRAGETPALPGAGERSAPLRRLTSPNHRSAAHPAIPDRSRKAAAARGRLVRAPSRRRRGCRASRTYNYIVV